jgi:predicted PurR-regulated permease PerM
MTETRPPDAAMPDRAKIGRRLAGIAAALGLLALAVWMLATFLPALAWAVVLAIATWPVFVAARARIGRDWAAMAMTVLILVVILAPLGFAIIEAGREYGTVVRWISELRRHEVTAPEWIANLPLVGAPVADWLNSRLRGEQSPCKSPRRRCAALSMGCCWSVSPKRSCSASPISSPASRIPHCWGS